MLLLYHIRILCLLSQATWDGCRHPLMDARLSSTCHSFVSVKLGYTIWLFHMQIFLGVASHISQWKFLSDHFFLFHKRGWSTLKGLKPWGAGGVIEGMQKRKTGTKDIPPNSELWQGAVMSLFIHSFIQLSKCLLNVNN